MVRSVGSDPSGKRRAVVMDWGQGVGFNFPWLGWSVPSGTVGWPLVGVSGSPLGGCPSGFLGRCAVLRFVLGWCWPGPGSS